MPVKVYVRRDSQARELPATHSHESWGTLDLIHRLWTAYSNQPTAYAVAVNLEKPSADLIIISQRGIGVVELKDVPGEIRQGGDGAWLHYYDGSLKRMKGGERNGTPRTNPHEQVRDYAHALRQNSQKQLTQWIKRDANNFRFNTAVCFTHPTADIEAFRHTYESPYHDWEKFQVITPGEIVKWVHTISFEDEQQSGNRYERSLLTQRQVYALPKLLFGMSESREIPSTMLTGEPYAYLTLLENNYPAQVFKLYPGSCTIGRDPNSTIPIPMRYGSVSRNHARILHSAKGTLIEDLNSKYGTYVDECRVGKKQSLRLTGAMHTITLCLPSTGDEHTCVLKFTKSPPASPTTWSMVT